MKVSVSMYSLVSIVREENWSVIDFLDYAKSIALDGVELLDIFWENVEDPDDEIEKVVNALKERNLKVSAYDVSNNFVVESDSERSKEIAKVIEGIRIAKKLGTNIVRVFCGDLYGDLSYEQAQQWIVDSLIVCAKVAEKEQVYLGIENHGLLAGKSHQVNEIIEQVDSPYVKSTFDTGNFLLVHEQPNDAFDRLKENIVHVHFKDFRKKDPSENINAFRSIQGEELIGTIPGDGDVDLKYVVEGLQMIGYEGWLSLEYEGIEEARCATKEAVNRLKNLANQ